MQKTAQKRSLLNKLRETVNMPGSYLEGFFKPEMDRVMTALKEMDDKIRADLTGQQIGNATPESNVSIKDLLKSARKNYNRREYMMAAADLGEFHKRFFDLTNKINKLFVDVNKIHHKFLFEGVDDERLKKFREHMERKANLSQTEYFIKEAGIMDFFHNIGTARGRGLAAWEKKYPKQTKDLRDGGARLLDMADDLLARSVAYLKDMSTARATRRPDDYMEAANRIKMSFDKFDGGDKGFKAYYQNAIMPFLKLKDEMDKSKEVPELPTPPVDPRAAGKVELGGTPSVPSLAPPVAPGMSSAPETRLPPPPGVPNIVTPAPSSIPMPGPPAMSPAPPSSPPAGTPVVGRMTPEEMQQLEEQHRIAHQKFITSLEAMGNEDPRILGRYIARYATSIQHTQPETAVELFAIVKQLKG